MPAELYTEEEFELIANALGEADGDELVKILNLHSVRDGSVVEFEANCETVGGVVFITGIYDDSEDAYYYLRLSES